MKRSGINIYTAPHTDTPPIPVGYRRFVVTHVHKGNGDPKRQEGWTVDAPVTAINSNANGAASLWYDDTDQSGEARITLRQIEASGAATDHGIKLYPMIQVVREWTSPVPSEEVK